MRDHFPPVGGLQHSASAGGNALGECTERLHTAATFRRKPSLSAICSAFSARMASVPEPTLPRPTIPTLTCCIWGYYSTLEFGWESNIVKSSTTFRLCTLICAALYTGRLGTAAIIVSTFSGTPPGYVNDAYQASRFTVPGPPGVPPSGSDWAMSLTVPVASDYFLSGISVPLFSNTGTSLADFTIASADASGAPGTPLELIQLSVSSPTPVIYTGNSTLHPLLTKGTTYWLELSAHNVGTTVTWNAAAGLQSGIAAGRVAGRLFTAGSFLPWSVTTRTQAAFSVSGTPTTAAVPEPATADLLGMGLLACAGFARRAKC